MAKVAFLGLGVMGNPMAGYLVSAGHDVTVYNRTTAKAEAWVAQHGGSLAHTPAEAARGAEFVMACVGNDDDLRSVVLGGDGALSAMVAGSVFVDHTTASAQVARELHAVADDKGVGFVDAPVSGGQAGAENGQLAIMCGGEEAVYATAEPIMNCYAKSCKHMGGVGAGQLTKMVNQICIAGLVQGLSEGINFAVKAGLNGEAVVEAISGGAAGSWQMVNRHKTMLANEYDHGFAVDWMRKDLSIVLDEAKQNDARLPVTALVDQFYGEVQDMGGGRWDTVVPDEASAALRQSGQPTGAVNNRPAFRIDRVGNAVLTVSTEQHVFERQYADEIAANWHAASDANPALFNGIVHLCASAQINDDRLQATCHAVRFATLLYWRNVADGAGLRNTFGDVILRGSDGTILLGHMAGHTANAGRWCLPGGSFDESDVVDGRIDPRRCISRECTEETGFRSDDYLLDPELLIYRDDRYVACAQVATLKIPGPEARQRILHFLAEEREPELDDIRLVRSAADAEAWIPDTYEARLIDYVFREET